MSQTASAIADGSRDFDFQVGSWNVHHQRLKERLNGCTDWEEFPGLCTVTPVLGGRGVVEDNVLHLPSGSYNAIAIRSFDPVSQRWAIWWLDGRAPHTLDVPVIGHFENGIGTFLAREEVNGKPILLRFLWLDTDTQNPRWEQAMSDDDGQTWETNWTMSFTRS